MRLFGLNLSVTKAAPAGSRAVDDSRGWFPLWSWGSGDREPGSWQRDERMSDDSIFAQATVFACMTLIASDWSKLDLRILQNYGGVWLPKTTEGLTDLLDQPNHFQTRQQFIESWALSKLSRGNTYVLKVRDRLRGPVTAMHVLNPDLVTPLVAPSGEVYYRLGEDDLAGIGGEESWQGVPASEIIHDRWNCLFHPLVGLSPIFANGLAASQSLRIQQASAKFFKNMARPGGMLTAPAKISDETAKRLKDVFERNFEGDNIGRLFVAGDGLKFDAFSVNAVDSQVVEQLKWSATTVAATFHVPPYMVGAAEPPALNNIEAEQQRYYSQCLQSLIEGAEACLDRGLYMKAPVNGATLRTDFNVDGLMRMDSKTLAEVEGSKVQRGISTINESRAKFNNLPVAGGETPFLQEQNWPVQLLANRDPAELKAPTPKPPTEDETKAIAARARMEVEVEIAEQKALEERTARELTDMLVRRITDGAGT